MKRSLRASAMRSWIVALPLRACTSRKLDLKASGCHDDRLNCPCRLGGRPLAVTPPPTGAITGGVATGSGLVGRPVLRSSADCKFCILDMWTFQLVGLFTNELVKLPDFLGGFTLGID